ncbi:MAG: hypothetical protein KIT09_02570 [Bryobacteraceae bacterium]|nr:hypothetical protein [Bryobacteraceae bacterium]
MKRLIVNMSDADHKTLRSKALAEDLTLSNYVRRALGLPMERQGVKAAAPPAKRARKRG